MRLPLTDYLALGLMAPVFMWRWFIRYYDRSMYEEERHHLMLQYFMLMGCDYNGYDLAAYDDDRTKHMFWCENWPYAYGDYSVAYDNAGGYAVHQYGIETASLRNVILTRQLEIAKWDNKRNIGPSR